MMTNAEADGRTGRRRRRWLPARRSEPGSGTRAARVVDPVPLDPGDPLLAFVTHRAAPLDVDALQLDTPGVRALREAGVRLLVPMVAQGELVGLLQLGERLSEQDYSSEDRMLLASIAGHAAPAMRLAQVIDEQAEVVRQRERYEQELRVAQLIQQRFLPSELPTPAGWKIAAFYRAAREVGGDFYDFIDLPDGRLGFVVGDVTDKGVPAALVMASTRSVLRAAAQRLVEPGAVLARVNDELARDMPPKMFVTCFYGVLDPADGHVVFANAGHDLPYLDVDGESWELRATGMPLGLMPGMVYDEAEVTIPHDGRLLVYSDGIAEAHAPDGDMFGFPRVRKELTSIPHGADITDGMLDALAAFTGAGWEQEDDITMITLERGAGQRPLDPVHFTARAEPGGERAVIEQVAAALASTGLAEDRLANLKTAVGEAAMNAMEHGNGYDGEIAVTVTLHEAAAHVEIVDHGSGGPAADDVAVPDLDAKLAGDQSPRGWGRFLMAQLVDEVQEHVDANGHATTLIVRLQQEDQ